MKKILVTMLALAILAVSASCSDSNKPDLSDINSSVVPEDNSSDKKNEAEDVTEGTVEDVLQAFLDKSGFEGSSFFEVFPVDEENVAGVVGDFEFKPEFESAVGYGPMIGSQAFSMAIFRLSPEQDAEAFAKELEAKADKNKWICVSADTVETAINGRDVLFIMTSYDFLSKEELDSCLASFACDQN